jgi:hypothetical protein
MVGRELAPLLGLAVAAAARRKHDRAGLDHELVAVLAPAGGYPAVLGRFERDQR